MSPVRRDLRQRSHNEQPIRSTGMRKQKTRFVTDDSAVGDEVQIDGPRSIGLPPYSPHAGLDPVQRGQHLLRREVRLDNGDTVDVVRL